MTFDMSALDGRRRETVQPRVEGARARRATTSLGFYSRPAPRDVARPSSSSSSSSMSMSTSSPARRLKISSPERRGGARRVPASRHGCGRKSSIGTTTIRACMTRDGARQRQGGAAATTTTRVTLVEARVATTAKSSRVGARAKISTKRGGVNGSTSAHKHHEHAKQPPSYETHLRRALEHAAEDDGVDADFIQRAIRQSVSRMASEHRDAATTLSMIQRYYDDRMEEIKRHENDADALQDERDALKSAYELVVCERDDAYSIRERARNAECDANRRLEALRIERNERIGDYNRLAHVIRQVYDGDLAPEQLEDIVRGLDEDDNAKRRRGKTVTFRSSGDLRDDDDSGGGGDEDDRGERGKTANDDNANNTHRQGVEDDELS